VKNIQIKLDYNEDKIKAIRVSLKLKNKNFDEEILKFLDGLYNKNVPKILKNYIEIGLEPENKTNEDVEDIEKIKKDEPRKLNTIVENNNNQR